MAFCVHKYSMLDQGKGSSTAQYEVVVYMSRVSSVAFERSARKRKSVPQAKYEGFENRWILKARAPSERA